MVDITDRVREMRNLVDAGKYLVFSRSRQYGKTTTLAALELHLLGLELVHSFSLCLRHHLTG